MKFLLTCLYIICFFGTYVVSNSLYSGCITGSGAIKESLDDFLVQPVPKNVTESINKGERDFSVHLIKSLFKKFNESNRISNIFVSPSSLYQTLMLAYFGARGETQTELQSLLGIEGLERQHVLKNYVIKRTYDTFRQQNANQGYQLTDANKFYFDRNLKLDECLQNILAGDLEAVDFRNSVKVTQEINAWVEEKTHQKIKEFLPSGAIDATTKVALVNAAYFKGEWSSKFENNDSHIDNFYVTRDQISKVMFMKQKGKFNYYTAEELRAHVLEMPYVGDEVSMIVILPPFEEHSLHKTVKLLTPETLRGVMDEIRSDYYKVDDLLVKFPRFKIEQTFEMAQTLSGLNLTLLFDPINSDLSGFLKPSSTATIKLDSAVHKSFIVVNEEGSEAAAASALFGFRSARPLQHKQFVANHPFMFFIYDKKNDMILFFGVFQNPVN